jgi:hypothetical protein
MQCCGARAFSTVQRKHAIEHKGTPPNACSNDLHTLPPLAGAKNTVLHQLGRIRWRVINELNACAMHGFRRAASVLLCVSHNLET